MIKAWFLSFFIFIIIPSFAQLRLPGFFSDSMVLQRNQSIPVWGWAGPEEKIRVSLGEQKQTTIADKNGLWRVNLKAMPAGGPYQLTVRGKNQIQLKNILLGDVWLCSGQSNMEWKVASSINASDEIKKSDNQNIRHIEIPKAMSGTPEEDISAKAQWKAASPGNTGQFTAVGYFFARELQSELNIPIGLIHSSWGGTDIETWISREALENNAGFKNVMANIRVLNLDSLAAVRKKNWQEKVLNWQKDIPALSEVQKWHQPYFDDRNWKSMEIPSLWEAQGLEGLDGVIWFRKDFFLSAEEASQAGQLRLSLIDDNDETYLNGVKAGAIKGYNLARTYPLPAGILKEGKNTIAVRIEDTGGGGGMYGLAEEMKLTLTKREIPLSGTWKYRIATFSKNTGQIGPNTYPSLLYNAMIHPLIPFGIKGAIWYQGENNAGRAFQYQKAFPLMINDWRSRWEEGNFPFYFVQLSSFKAAGGNSREGSTWAELREAQTKTLSLPQTGMAVTTDIGETDDIHPRNKQDVGKRLAYIALHKTYEKDITYSGPVFKQMNIKNHRALISFIHTGKGLKIKGADGVLKGFSIAGNDQVFYEARAVLEGDKVAVFSDSVPQPAAVRYAWADDAGEANLFNREDLPAVPFRTDNWKGITEENKYPIKN